MGFDLKKREEYERWLEKRRREFEQFLGADKYAALINPPPAALINPPPAAEGLAEEGLPVSEPTPADGIDLFDEDIAAALKPAGLERFAAPFSLSA